MSTQTPPRRRRPPAAAPARPLSPVPTFLHPQETDLPGPPAETDMPLIEERTTGPTLDNTGPGPGVPWPPYGDVGSQDTIRTRTDHSSETLNSGTSKAELGRNAGILLAGILSVTAGALAVILARTGRQLRRPTRDENRAIARPLARIFVRHVPAEFITADLADLGEAGAAIEEYVAAGPVAPRLQPIEHIGMEHGGDFSPDFSPDDPAPVTPAAPNARQIWHDATLLDQNPTALHTTQPMEVTYAP
jgi:hypothetical protein